MKLLHPRYIKKRFRSIAFVLCCICLISGGSIKAEAKNASTAISMGIDVSRYQGDINWKAVAGSGVQFAFIRIGSTLYGIDAKFDQNMRMASENGIRTGVYLYSYAKNAQEAAAEAVFALNAISNYTVSMPVVIDIEAASQKKLSPATLSEIANTFCAIIENAGYYPMIYSSKNWFADRIGPVGYDKWVAQYNASCSVEDAAFWQASSTGVIPGISGNVDIDYQYKDLSGSIVANGFVFRKGFYYFYENYKMKTNALVQYDGGIYYVDGLGRRVSGLAQIGSSIFYFDVDGKMQFGWQNIAGQMYFFDPVNGNMCFGWLNDGTGIFYTDESGQMKTGMITVGGDQYYMGTDGRMQAGLQDIGGQIYYFDLESGKLQRGWALLGEGQYYFDPISAAMAKGWTVIDDWLYCFDPDTGQMYCGLHQIGDNIYWFDPDGKLVVNRQMEADGMIYISDTNGCVTCIPNQ